MIASSIRDEWYCGESVTQKKVRNFCCVVATPSCEMLKISWQTGKHLVKGDSENHFMVQSFRLVQWLNIIRFLQETSQGTTNLVRKFYFEYSSDMC